MLIGSSLSIVACLVVGLTGYFLHADESLDAETDPPLIVINDEIDPENPRLCGTVYDNRAGIRVDARLPNGRSLHGSPDTSSDDQGSQNYFCFPTPPIPGMTVTIVATDADFNQTRVQITLP